MRAMAAVSTRLKAELGLALATMIWGSAFTASKAGLDFSSPLVFVAARSVVGGLALLLVFRSVLPRIGAGELKSGALIGLFLFCGFACVTTGMNHTTASKAAFINSFEAVLPAVLLAVFWRRGGPPLLWLGAAAALCGLYLMSVPPAGVAALNRGDILVFCGAVLFSLHTIVMGFLTPHHEVGALALLQVNTAAVLGLAGVPLFAASGMERPRLEMAPALLVALLVSGIGSLAIGLTIQTWAQRHTPASHAALFFSMIPVFASITSYFFLGERMGRREAAGAACIFAGVLMASLSRSRATEAEAVAADAAGYDLRGGV
jgi:drug/metabolite transporter (DMT)-like permease